MCSHLVPPLLTSSGSSQIYSADLSSCQLVSPHPSYSQCTLKSSHLFSSPKPAHKTDLGVKASNPYAFHREDLAQRSFYTQQTFAQRSYWIRRSFYTELGKLLFTARFYTKQALAQSKSFYPENRLHTEAFTQRSLYTEKLLHTASFDTKKLLHREAFTHTQKLLHTHTRKLYTKKLLHTANFHTQPAFTQKNFKHAEKP